MVAPNVVFQKNNWHWHNLPAVSDCHRNPNSYLSRVPTGVTGLIADYLIPPHRFVTVKPWEGFRFNWISCARMQKVAGVISGLAVFSISILVAAPVAYGLLNLAKNNSGLIQITIIKELFLIVFFGVCLAPIYTTAIFHDVFYTRTFKFLLAGKIELISRYYKSEGRAQVTNVILNLESAKTYFEKLESDYKNKITNALPHEKAGLFKETVTAYFKELTDIVACLHTQYPHPMKHKLPTVAVVFMGRFHFIKGVIPGMSIEFVKNRLLFAAVMREELDSGINDFLRIMSKANESFDNCVKSFKDLKDRYDRFYITDTFKNYTQGHLFAYQNYTPTIREINVN